MVLRIAKYNIGTGEDSKNQYRGSEVSKNQYQDSEDSKNQYQGSEVSKNQYPNRPQREMCVVRMWKPNIGGVNLIKTNFRTVRIAKTNIFQVRMLKPNIGAGLGSILVFAILNPPFFVCNILEGDVQHFWPELVPGRAFLELRGDDLIQKNPTFFTNSVPARSRPQRAIFV